MAATTTTMIKTRLRFMKRFSSLTLRFPCRLGYFLARRKAHPQNFHSPLDAIGQRRIAVKRPHQQRPEDGLTKHLRQLQRRHIPPELSTLLSDLYQLRKQSFRSSTPFPHHAPHRRTGKV